MYHPIIPIEQLITCLWKVAQKQCIFYLRKHSFCFSTFLHIFGISILKYFISEINIKFIFQSYQHQPTHFNEKKIQKGNLQFWAIHFRSNVFSITSIFSISSATWRGEGRHFIVHNSQPYRCSKKCTNTYRLLYPTLNSSSKHDSNFNNYLCFSQPIKTR